jgi:hypothetical protein
MGAYRYCGACLTSVVVLVAACGGSPNAPRRLPDSPAVSQLRITGLPPALSPGATAQLKAELVLQTGAVNECAATWAVDDAKVAGISSSGLLTAGMTGYVNVTASCEGIVARLETKVETISPHRFVIVAYDSEVGTELGVEATMEFLDGPRRGEIVPRSVYASGMPDVSWPVKVRFTAEDYEPKNFILDESTGTRRNSLSPLFDFRVPMTFIPDALTDTYVRRMSSTEMEIAHPFMLRLPGAVRIRTWWAVDYNDRLTIELWCGGQLLRRASQHAGSAGSGFTHDVEAPGACEVKLRQLKSDASTRYRVAISYPR